MTANGALEGHGRDCYRCLGAGKILAQRADGTDGGTVAVCPTCMGMGQLYTPEIARGGPFKQSTN